MSSSGLGMCLGQAQRYNRKGMTIHTCSRKREQPSAGSVKDSSQINSSVIDLSKVCNSVLLQTTRHLRNQTMRQARMHALCAQNMHTIAFRMGAFFSRVVDDNQLLRFNFRGPKRAAHGMRQRGAQDRKENAKGHELVLLRANHMTTHTCPDLRSCAE